MITIVDYSQRHDRLARVLAMAARLDPLQPVVLFVGVALAIPAGGMLTDWLFTVGLWPHAEWHP